jgi:multidrug efflux pump subunit AcrA (membrane-fusion protein)
MNGDPSNPASASSPVAVSEGRLSASPPLPLEAERRLVGGSVRGPSSSRLPRARGWSNGRMLLVLGGLLLVFVGALAFVLYLAGALFVKAPFNGPTALVKKERLKITIVARGTLESAKNGDILCNVRSGTKGSTIASTIKWLIDNGAEVQKDDKVIELDDSGLKEQLKAQNITVDEKKAAEITAAEKYRSDDIQCQIDIEKAINARDLAKLDLEKYIEGDFVQALSDIDGKLETAQSDLENWKDRAAWSSRMQKKGLMSKVQADADASRVDGARISLKSLEESKRVLVDFTKKRTIQDLTAKVSEAERFLEKTKIQTKATLAQDEANYKAAKSIYEQELAKKHEVEAEIAKCTIRAPQDGLVVYYVPEQVRGGGGSQQSIIAQGEPVREGQKMMQIPDLSQMLVNVRVPEAFVSHLHNEEDPKDKSTWQHAQIRVDAHSTHLLQGHVRTVDTVASTQDFFAADVKVYKTIVKIDQQFEGLRPGMSAEVTIFAHEGDSDVLVVPIQAVVGTISMGAKRKCFVIGPDGQPVMRDIVVGMSNERKVEVKAWDAETQTGLKEGERVVENPTPLIPPDTDMRAGKVRSKGEDDGHGGDNGEGKKGKGKGKKKMDGFPSGPDGGFKSGPDGFKGGPAPAPGGAAQFTPEMQQKMQQFMARFQAGSPTERRDMINELPAEFREKTRKMAQEKGLQVAD